MLDKPFCRKGKLTECIEKIISEEIKRGNDDAFHEVFSSGSLTQCPRRIIYRTFSKDKKFPEETDKIRISHINTKSKWVDILARNDRVTLIDRDLKAADCNYNVVGKIDAVLKIRETKLIFMVKPVNQTQFKEILSKGPPRKDIVETMVNMWLVEISHGLLFYEDSDGELDYYHITPCLPIIDEVKRKCRLLLRHKVMGSIPARPYNDPNTTECNSCSYKHSCWSEA